MYILDLSIRPETMDKMDHYGIRGVANEWFKSYLTDRKQYVLANGKKSGIRCVNIGVPQGSVLGPLLFLVYVNDIHNAVDFYCKLILFADDTNSFLTDNDPIQLITKAKVIMKQLSNWFEDNGLILSIEKTQYLIFHTRKRSKDIPSECDTLTVDNVTIKRAKYAKFLGLTLDETLSWRQHIDSLTQTLVRYATSFKVISKHVPQKCKKQLYYAYIYARLQYGIEVYGSASTSATKKLQTNQNRALKILFNKDYFENTTKLHRDLGLLKVADISNKHIMSFVYKQQHDILPSLFNTYYKQNIHVHNHRTRTSNKLHISKTKTSLAMKSIKIKGAKLYNSLEHTITNIKTYNTFKKEVTKFLPTKYNVT